MLVNCLTWLWFAQLQWSVDGSVGQCRTFLFCFAFEKEFKQVNYHSQPWGNTILHTKDLNEQVQVLANRLNVSLINGIVFFTRFQQQAH